MDIFIVQQHGHLGENFSLQDNTYYFRVRYVVPYFKANKTKYIVGPFSEVAAIGKNVKVELPTFEIPPKPKAELLMVIAVRTVERYDN
jgi:hypothetical protein